MTSSPPAVALRRLERTDLPFALAIQWECYPPNLQEGSEAFASRLELADCYCLAASVGDELAGYLLAHGWPSRSPPPLDASLPKDKPSEVLFIHDLAVGCAGRRLGIGRRLVDLVFAMANRDGLEVAELIAVEGAASYWRTLGFAEAEATPALAEKVAEYGRGARWMTRRLGSASSFEPPCG